MWRPESKHWTRTIDRLRPGKALDPGGWSHETVQQAWSNAATAHRIREWLESYFARASVPEAQLMQMHRTVLLTKPGSTSIRPILVSTIWKKILAGATTQAVRPLFEDLFAHSQYGIGIAGGASSMHRNLTSQLLQNEDFAFLQLDFANAFGAIHRTAVQQAIEHTLGEHPTIPWLRHYSAQPATIAIPTAARAERGGWQPTTARAGRGEPPSYVQTSCGLPQGDPLSALLFCATVTWALQRHLPQSLGHVEYVDDVVLSGPMQSLDESFNDLKQSMAGYGLHLEDTKCKLWDPARRYVPIHPRMRALWDQNLSGLAICGSCLAPDTDEELPLGSEAFRSQWFKAKADQMMTLCAVIDTLPRIAEEGKPSLQLAIRLLAEAVPARLRHVWAASPWNEQTAFLEAVQEITTACLKSILDLQSLLPTQQTVVHLPPHLGGLGICNIVVEAALARASELVAAPRSNTTCPSILHDIDKEREALFTLLQNHMDIPIESVFGNLAVAPLGRQPRRLARGARKIIYSTTAKRLHATLLDQPSLMTHKVRRLQLDEDQPLVGACLQTWPTSWKTSLTNQQMRRICTRRLGHPVPGAPGPCQRMLPQTGTQCLAPMDVAGHHCHVCCRHLMRTRHDSIRDHFATFARAAGLHAATEQRTTAELRHDEPAAPQTQWTRPARTADVHIVDRAGHDLYADVRVYAATPLDAPKQMMEQQEAAKRREYGLPPCVSTSPFDGVRPVLFELGGAVSRSTWTFGRHLIHAHAMHAMLQRSMTWGNSLGESMPRVLGTLGFYH